MNSDHAGERDPKTSSRIDEQRPYPIYTHPFHACNHLELNHNQQIKYALQPLYDLTTRYPPSLSHLTPLHSLFLTSIVRSRHYTLALPLLRTPITTISTTLSPDLTYNDNLVYHYSGGVVWAVLKKWSEAEEFFESVVCAPGQGGVGSALQLEALKKLVLVQLISKGKVRLSLNPSLSPPPIKLPLILVTDEKLTDNAPS